jgi:hypothetical protein
VAYYRRAAGKAKKKQLNARRSCRSTPSQQPMAPEAPAAATAQAIPASEPHRDLTPKGELRFDGVVLNEGSLLKSRMLGYVRMVVSLIEGIEFSYQELFSLLQQALRQHSIARRTRREYVLCFLYDHPP